MVQSIEKLATDFPGETFRVLKEKEEKQYDEYRTRRLVFEIWITMGLRDKKKHKKTTEHYDVSELVGDS